MTNNRKAAFKIAEKSKKMGRPIKSEEPRNTSLHLRITESEAERIQRCSEKLHLNRTETIMQAIALLDKSS